MTTLVIIGSLQMTILLSMLVIPLFVSILFAIIASRQKVKK